MGLLGLAAKNMQEENRSLLKKNSPFDELANNKFINAPNLNYKVTKADYQVLQCMKKQKIRKANKHSVFIRISVLVLLVVIFMASWLMA